ncbi:alpha/beta fold hydrolase [Roseomonas sp. ROY-5-3]|uniref:Alpha/beta fold hydrolase n=2 Tax=Acetobacterales TaxID=3120395 RepID=A0ABS6HC26_9PROT|nr:alpha/beta fold hydrolase [Roseomonas oleicola]
MRRAMMILAGLLLVLILGAGAWLYTPDRPRAALEAAYATPPSAFLDVAGLRLHLRDTGPRDAPALLMLHGFGASLHTWEDWAAGLEADYRVIRIDLPGFGLTGADPSGDYSDARAHAVLLALLDRLGLPRATLIGSSMGGRIAWGFAAAHPDRVAKLVLVSPDGFASPGSDYGRRASVPLLMRVLPYTLPRGMLRGTLAAAYADPARMTAEVEQRSYELMLAPGVRQAVLDRMAGHVLPDPVPLLGRITAPTLLLWGERDGMIPVTNAQDYLAALPDATLVTLPGIGHVPQEEAPRETLVPLRDFLMR